ncbi:MAG: copper-translocating P-type ATPase [Candidatus Puniceispirillum sp.]|nr:copper-translocating P-type ATPase [Candidatus Puniceispirillum sp.]
MIQDYKTRFWISLCLSLPIFLLSPMAGEMLGKDALLVFPGSDLALFLLACTLFIYGGRPFLTGLTQEVGRKAPGMMTLIGIAISVSFAYSVSVLITRRGTLFFWELASLIDIMLLGHWIEMRAVMGAGRALEALTRLMPEIAHKIDGSGTLEDVPTQNLQKGDLCLIKPGERLPADGEIIQGKSAIDESMLTGELVPVLKQVGDRVLGGSLNTDGALTIRLNHLAGDTFLSHVMTLVQEAQESKSKTQTLAARAASLLTYVALIAGGVTFFFWGMNAGTSWSFALERAVTVMVITCPHALGLAIPLVVATSTAMATKRGILVRSREAFEDARRVDVVLFDKTGTLTTGSFVVNQVISFNDTYSPQDILNYAASIEVASQHPLAKGIVAAAKAPFTAQDCRLLPGEGAQGLVGGQDVKVVSPGFVERARYPFDEAKVASLSAQGETLVFVLINNTPQGLVSLTDDIRLEAKEAVRTLQSLGVKCYMITGDANAPAKRVSEALHMDGYFAQMRPSQKLEKIQELQSTDLRVAMVGDGVNDAPALARADVGIAIGAGTDVAMESAHVILVHSDPRGVTSLIRLAKSTYAKMIQNLVWATGYNVIAIPLAAGVFISWGLLLPPTLGAVLMSGSTLLCAINAKLLKS